MAKQIVIRFNGAYEDSVLIMQIMSIEDKAHDYFRVVQLYIQAYIYSSANSLTTVGFH